MLIITLVCDAKMTPVLGMCGGAINRTNVLWQSWEEKEYEVCQQTAHINHASVNHFLLLPFIDWSKKKLEFTTGFLLFGGYPLLSAAPHHSQYFHGVSNNRQPAALTVFAFFVLNPHNHQLWFLRTSTTISKFLKLFISCPELMDRRDLSTKFQKKGLAIFTRNAYHPPLFKAEF